MPDPRDIRELAESEACPACAPRMDYGNKLRRFCRLHTDEERAKYHPMAGHGFNGVNWTHPLVTPPEGRE